MLKKKPYEEIFGVSKWEFEILCMLYCAQKRGVEWIGQITTAEVATKTTVFSAYPKVRIAAASLDRQGLVVRKRRKPNDGWRSNICVCLSLTERGCNKVEKWLT